MKMIRKTGVCISGPACSERKRSAIPAAHISAVRLISSASEYMPSKLGDAAADLHPDGERDRRQQHPDEQARPSATSA